MIEEIKKLLKSKELIMGTELTVKNLKLGNVKKVFLSSNCPADVREDIDRYGKLAGAEIVQLDVPNDELGALCRKPFSISVISILKAEK